MEVQHQHTDSKGAFYIEDQGKHAAEMTYSLAGPAKMIIDHTEVDDSYRGQNLGLKLMETAVAYVRQQHIKIMPLCPFAKAQLHKNKQWHDVLV